MILRSIKAALGRLDQTIYNRLCGVHPHVRLWHFQWSALKDLYRDLRDVLPLLRGRVLDVGCGNKPYRTWCTSATEHFGIDVIHGPHVDLVVQPNQPWALPTAGFDAVLCTQVIEHVTDLEHVVGEMARVLRPGGLLVISVPFMYQAHGLPYDFRRMSAEGVSLLLRDHFQVASIRREGGIGSTLATLVLGWLQAYTTQRRWARLLKFFFLPVWLGCCGVVNLAGLLGDAVDPTHAFYGNVLVTAVRR